MNRHELRIRGERMGVRDPNRIDTGILLENVRLVGRIARLEAELLALRKATPIRPEDV